MRFNRSGIGRNNVVSSAIDKLYNASPLAIPSSRFSCAQFSHNGTFNSSVSSGHHGYHSSGYHYKVRPSIQFVSAESDANGRRLNGTMYDTTLNSLSGAENCDDASVLLSPTRTTQEILTSLDASNHNEASRDRVAAPRHRVEPSRDRVALSLCLTPRYLASKNNSSKLDDIDEDNITTSSNDSLESILANNNYSPLKGDDNNDDFDLLAKGAAPSLHRETSNNQNELVQSNRKIQADGASAVKETSGRGTAAPAAEAPTLRAERSALESSGTNDGDASTSHTKEYALHDWTIRTLDSHRSVLVEGLLINAGQKVLWRSTGVVKAIDKRTVLSGTGSVYKLVGPLNTDVACTFGFSKTLCTAFRNGFPTNWAKLLSKHFAEIENKNDEEDRKKQKTKRGLKKPSKPSYRHTKSMSTPPVCEPLDLDTCERTRSGRVVVPSSAVAWWRGIRLYTTPYKPLEIRVDTPLANRLDSPLAWSQTGGNNKSRRRTPAVTKPVTPAVTKPVTTAVTKPVHTEAKPKKMKTSIKICNPRDNGHQVQADDKASTTADVESDGTPLSLVRSPYTYPAHRSERSRSSADRGKFRELFATNKGEESDRTAALRSANGIAFSPRVRLNRNEGEKGRRRVTEPEVEPISTDMGDTDSVDDRGARLRRDGRKTRETSKQTKKENAGNLGKRSKKSPSATKDRSAKTSLVEDSGRIEGRTKRTRNQTSLVGDSGRIEGRTKRTRNQTSLVEDSGRIEGRTKRTRNQTKSGTQDSSAAIEIAGKSKSRVAMRKSRKKAQSISSSEIENETVARPNGLSKVCEPNTKELSDESDTDDQILAARLRLRQRARASERAPNVRRSGRGHDPSRRQSQEDKLCVQMVNEFGDSETIQWSEDESKRFKRALMEVPAASDDYWTKVAALTQTKTADQCRAFYLRDVPTSVKRPTVTAKPVLMPKIVVDDNKQVRVELSGGKNTFKRKRQVQMIINHMNADFDNDYFNSTPWVKRKQRKLDVLEDGGGDTPQTRGATVNTPNTRLLLMPRSEMKTPHSSLISPSVPADDSRDELYIHRCVKGLRGKVGHSAANQTAPIGPNVTNTGRKSAMRRRSAELARQTSLLVELTQNGQDEDVADSDQDKDDYFSDQSD